jgi:hypothetical protein
VCVQHAGLPRLPPFVHTAPCLSVSRTKPAPQLLHHFVIRAPPLAVQTPQPLLTVLEQATDTSCCESQLTAQHEALSAEMSPFPLSPGLGPPYHHPPPAPPPLPPWVHTQRTHNAGDSPTCQLLPT